MLHKNVQFAAVSTERLWETEQQKHVDKRTSTMKVKNHHRLNNKGLRCKTETKNSGKGNKLKLYFTL